VSDQRFRVAIGLALLLVSLVYLLQIASPLRLIVDGIDYYFQQNALTLRGRGVFGNILCDLESHALGLGELAANAPLSKLPPLLRRPVQLLGLSN